MSQRSVGETLPATTFEEVAMVDETTGAAWQIRRVGDGRGVGVTTNVSTLFSDDFGGAAIDATRWDLINGGLGANPNLGAGVFTQGAIGTGVTGITDSVAASALTVAMGTTSNAERWYLSKTIFIGAPDLTVLLSRSQALAANSIFVGLVEVDPTTGVPLLNANLAGDFRNRGGVEFGQTTGTQTARLEAVADSSGVAATVSNASYAPAAMTTTFESLIEFAAEDITATGAPVDSAASKSAAAAMRVSTQCPDDGKAYKLLLRFRNIGAPGSNTNVVIQRVLVVDSQEQRVEIAGGRGDSAGQKGVPVNVANTPTVNVGATSNNPGGTAHRVIAAASTNATLLKASPGKITSGFVHNLTAAKIFLKFYNKASAPTVGTDTPMFTVPIEAGQKFNVSEAFDLLGVYFSTGVAYAITAALADADTTALAAGDAVVNFVWV